MSNDTTDAYPDSADDIVATYADAAGLAQPPLIIIEGLEPLVPGSGPLKVVQLGKGKSNETFLVERDATTWVLRRPPRPPWPQSAHDVLREHAILDALTSQGIPVPRLLLACSDHAVIGAPFYIMEFVDGVVVRDTFPPELDDEANRRQSVISLAETLADVHAVEWRGTALEALGRPSGYLERQLRRWTGNLETTATRNLPDLVAVGDWLAANRPEHSEVTLVHGDYKLDNVILALGSPTRVVAVVDWEMATIGDPLADLGLFSVVYVEPGEIADPVLGFSAATSAPGCPTRDEMIQVYQRRSGRKVDNLHWYECFAMWKLAIIIEGGYKRYLAGTTQNDFFEHAREGVPRLAARALALTLT